MLANRGHTGAPCVAGEPARSGNFCTTPQTCSGPWHHALLGDGPSTMRRGTGRSATDTRVKHRVAEGHKHTSMSSSGSSWKGYVTYKPTVHVDRSAVPSLSPTRFISNHWRLSQVCADLPEAMLAGVHNWET